MAFVRPQIGPEPNFHLGPEPNFQKWPFLSNVLFNVSLNHYKIVFFLWEKYTWKKAKKTNQKH